MEKPESRKKKISSLGQESKEQCGGLRCGTKEAINTGTEQPVPSRSGGKRKVKGKKVSERKSRGIAHEKKRQLVRTYTRQSSNKMAMEKRGYNRVSQPIRHAGSYIVSQSRKRKQRGGKKDLGESKKETVQGREKWSVFTGNPVS